ncbi:thiamine ABC transporter substrate binding subunit [Chachezhania antarctica]|uniref:thiamine ABC transporter substrate binding subunit n=1 Tax=Chachezhania antarctica TaxID=2340860 RepID=UPI000EB0065C|nr:thiamine ABC transporter substrate binding subunit [Chachezhania antarctica]|tara:strand:- start:11462 stop:12451 length:990 start_codon:yes stop_codon:yes gene_type:complete
MRHLVIAALFTTTALAPAFAQDAKPELTVYTYDSFVSDWGPGPVIEEAFEETCNCDLNFVSAGDGAALLSRLRLEGERSEADIVLGLDTNLMAAAAETGLFAPSGVSAEYDMPIEWTDETFIPFDWGFFAFVHDKDMTFPADFEALGASDVSLVIQDPRSSTPGLGLLLWIQTAYGERAGEIWEGLSDNIVTVTPGWSEAYGLFLNGEADAVLSYTTSPAYHVIAEDDDSKTSAAMAEGNYLQIEVAAKLAATDQPDLADQFLEFMVTNGFQSAIPTTNWMYPSVMPDDGLPDGFEGLVTPDKALLIAPADVPGMRKEALDTWQAALNR